MKKLASIAALTVALFLASFAAAFGLAMGVAHAQPSGAPGSAAAGAADGVGGETAPSATPVEGAPAETPGAPGERPQEPATATDETRDAASVTQEAAGADARKPGHGKSTTEAADGHAEGEHHGDPSEHFNFFGGPFSHNGKDVAGGKFGDGVNRNEATGATVPGEEEPMSAPFIYMILNFALLLGLLAWKGGPMARQAAQERHDQIKTALDEAARLRKEAQDKLAEYETRLKDADAEIQRMVDGMRADAEADKKRILEAAERQSAQMKRDAEQRIAAEIELARAALTREVTAVAVSATERLLREKMQPADQQKLVASFIGDVQSAARKEIR